jgi:hypothetical protein|tara:strand:- start:3506 stop:3745 length:240 start_codon:yes stop_codon:yes gene_type:complete
MVADVKVVGDERNSCCKCEVVRESEDFIWITAEDFTPLPQDNLTQKKLNIMIKKGYDCLCEECYLFEIKTLTEQVIEKL